MNNKSILAIGMCLIISTNASAAERVGKLVFQSLGMSGIVLAMNSTETRFNNMDLNSGEISQEEMVKLDGTFLVYTTKETDEKIVELNKKIEMSNKFLLEENAKLRQLLKESVTALQAAIDGLPMELARDETAYKLLKVRLAYDADEIFKLD